ncbi:hypothetical protein EDD17DRAFT_1225061 [Pisolithus thermaeus]|nr:hypothetical protein EDD17DRAFT_1225061 [Pisolithus thermaeus]
MQSEGWWWWCVYTTYILIISLQGRRAWVPMLLTEGQLPFCAGFAFQRKSDRSIIVEPCTNNETDRCTNYWLDGGFSAGSAIYFPAFAAEKLTLSSVGKLLQPMEQPE